MNFVKILKTYPKQSQRGGYGAAGSGNPGNPGLGGSGNSGGSSSTSGTPTTSGPSSAGNPSAGISNNITTIISNALPNSPRPVSPNISTGLSTIGSPGPRPSSVTPAGAPLPVIPNVPESIQQEYIDNGLTFKSNNQYVTDRDAAGNIKFQISGSDNRNLVIEPAIENFTNSSFINAVDTQFNYFKFPASIKAADIPESTINEINFNLGLADGITARYVVAYEEDEQGDPLTFKKLNVNQDTGKFKSAGKTYNRNYNTNYWYSQDFGKAVTDWKLNTDIDVPLQANGFRKIPFKQKIAGGGNQIEPGTFTLTQEMIDTLRENNQTIKFRIRIQITRPSFGDIGQKNDYRYQAYGPDWDGEATMKLERSMPTQFRTFVKPEDTVSGMTASNPYAELQLDYIIDIKNDAFKFDKYYITAGGAVVDNTSQLPVERAVNQGKASVFFGMMYNREGSYWEILVIDDPGGNYGDQNI